MAADPFATRVVLLMPLDGAQGSTSFYDKKGHVPSVVGTPIIDTSKFKFGGSSLKYASGDYSSVIVIPGSTDLTFFNTDFTVEGWVWASSNQPQTYPHLFGSDPSSWGGDKWSFLLDHASLPGKVSVWSYNLTSAPLLKSPGPLPRDTWCHVALVRKGSTYRLFVDGAVMDDTLTSGVALTPGATFNGGASVSSTFSIGNSMNGNFDDVRVTLAARYWEPFAPPAQANSLETYTVELKVMEGSNAVPRWVRVYSRSTGALLSEGMSNPTSGVFKAWLNDYQDTVFAVVLDDDAGMAYNALVFDSLTPKLESF